MLRYLKYAAKYAHSRFVAHRPIILTHMVTSLCNCRCKTCELWKRGYNRNEMTTEEVHRLLEEAWALNLFSYVLWGGEPLMRQDLGEILGKAKALGFHTTVITNGFLLPDKAEAIGDLTDLLIVSIDHSTPYHDETRGRKGVYERALKGITAFKNHSHAGVLINTVVSRLNLEDVRGMADLASKLSVNITYELMDIYPGYNEEYMPSAAERKDTFTEVMQLKRLGYPIVNSDAYLEYLAGAGEGYSCLMPRVYLRILEDGEVLGCPIFNEKLGNVKEEKLRNILASPAYRKFTAAAQGCSLCNVSCVVETSLIYSGRASRALLKRLLR